MAKNSKWTRIVFRTFKRGISKGEVIALLIDTANDCCTKGNVMSYMHVGQHCETNYNGIIAQTRRATPEEYVPLADELRRIGYSNIEVVYRKISERRTPTKHQTTMANKKLYAVTTIYQEQGGHATKALIGVFTNEEKAATALETTFHKACDSMGVEELNGYSYFTESDSFHICDGKEETWHYDGEIEEVEEDLVYTDESPYLISEHDSSGTMEKTEKVYSIAQLTEQINNNIKNKDSEPVELIVQLNYGSYSRKSITFADEQDESGFSKFEVFNHIDDTTQILSLNELFDDTKTNLGKAINAGAVFMVIDNDD